MASHHSCRWTCLDGDRRQNFKASILKLALPHSLPPQTAMMNLKISDPQSGRVKVTAGNTKTQKITKIAASHPFTQQVFPI